MNRKDRTKTKRKTQGMNELNLQQTTQEQRGKKKTEEEPLDKPYANNLGQDEELHRIFNKISGKPHPLNRANIFQKLVFSYINQYILLAKKMIPTQDCHHLLPEKEQVDKNRANIGKRIYPADQDDGLEIPTDSGSIGFKMFSTVRSNLFIAFMKVIKKEFFLCFVLFCICAAFNFGRLIILKRGLQDVTDQINQYGRIVDKNSIFLDFLAVWAINIVTNTLENAVMMEVNRFTLRLEGGLHGLMYEKFMRIGVVNPHEHDEGSIINYIQTDVESFNKTVLGLGIFLATSVTLFASLYMGLYLFGHLFWVLVVGFIICSVLTGTILAMVIFNYRNAKKATDKRLDVMKNMLKNIKFVKVAALENFMFAKLSKARDSEVKYTVNSARWVLIMTGTSRFLIGVLLIVFFYYFMNSGAAVTVANVTTLLMVFNMFMFSMIGTVGGLGLIASSYVHVQRLTCFLNAREMVDFYRVKKEDPYSEFAVQIENGEFFWDKKMTKEEAEKKRKEAIKGSRGKKRGRKSAKKGKEIPDSDDLISQVDSMVAQEGTGAQEGGQELQKKLIEDGEEVQNEGREIGFEMNGINFRARKGGLTVLIGKIGSGKSSLLYSILGEMRVKDVEKTSVVVNGTVGFLSQNPWLINGTVKENILLDKTYNEQKFAWAVKYSALDHDIKLWDDKEDHIIGENGAALSGGQKARIALARCLYQEPDVYIFDDILSALDGRIGAFITEETILGQLKEKTVIMVTHGLQYLKYSDYIYVIDEGKIIQEGTFTDIEDSELYQKFLQLNRNQEDITERRAINPLSESEDILDTLQTTTTEFGAQGIDPSTETDHFLGNRFSKPDTDALTRDEQLPLSDKADDNSTEDTSEGDEIDIPVTKKLVEKLNRKEDREIGQVSWDIFKKFLRNMGGPIPLIIMIIISLSSNFFNTFYQKLLEDFSNNFKNEDLGSFLKKLFYVNLAMALLIIVGSFISVALNRKISTQLHSKMAFSLTHARLQGFLESVAYGQIQNRFSKDIGDVDSNASSFFSSMINNLSSLAIFLLAIMYSISWAVVFALVICTIVVFKIQSNYMTARREYKRLQAISSSPIVSNCSDIIRGLSYIRNMGLSEYFRKKYVDQVTEKLKNDLLINVMQLWFTVRCNLALSFVVILPAIAGFIYLFDDINPANIGLFFIVVNQMSRRFESTVDMKTKLETFLISIERCDYFSKLEPEPGYKTLPQERALIGNGKAKDIKKLLEFEKKGDLTNKDDLNESRLVKSGRIMFENVHARYMGSKSNVLHGVSFSTEKGEKVGIVGRSGSGKSTLVKLLWRYMKAEEGSIMIDGHDLSRVDIKALRSQLTVITQETALFEGTLKYNLDPTEYRFGEAQMTALLERLGFENSEYKKKGLEMEIDSEGTNLSQGEKQLICFARAALRPSSIVLLDEATASIDIKTEEAIQNLIKTDFKESTMIIVAHRVHTVMECDKIIVMKDGRIEAVGRPDELMETSEFFSEIVQKMKEQ